METRIIESDAHLLLWQLFLTVLFVFIGFVIIKILLFIKKASQYIDLKTASIKGRKQEL
ncbi:hypothetical protein ACFO3O_12740 [Dokdonia ponticola]|uniref:CcmD family protein n=1 Tax=Dokdonia ponticola TaxID=2041041 RepID=A0ABV9HX95_9FLAO